MIFRAIDNDGDWTFGNGRQNYATGNLAIALNVKTRLLCFQNDCFWNLPFGVDWWNLIGAKSPAADVSILAQTRMMLSGSYGIVSIVSIDAFRDARTRRFAVSYEVDTIFSARVRNTATLPV